MMARMASVLRHPPTSTEAVTRDSFVMKPPKNGMPIMDNVPTMKATPA